MQHINAYDPVSNNDYLSHFIIFLFNSNVQSNGKMNHNKSYLICDQLVN